MPWFLKLVAICAYIIFASGGAVWLAVWSGLGAFSFLFAALPFVIPYLYLRRNEQQREHAKAMPCDGWYDPTEKQKP